MPTVIRRKIVIIPSFASSHLLKCWLPNVIGSIKPDIIIINEGIFPNGPENKGHIDQAFRDKWCYSGPNTNGVVGFDWVDTVATFMDFCVTSNCKGHLVGLNYKPDWDANKCFLTAVSTFHKYEPEVEDIIFPIEPDAFLLETDAKVIQEEIEKLKPGEGLKCLWRDFLETQYYCEAINEVSPKVRRFCYCFDNMDNYKKAMDGFMSQSYPNLQYTDKFWIRHYPWFVHDKWKELRCELVWRKDPKYWQDFESGLQNIRSISERVELNKYYSSHEPWNFDLTLNFSECEKVLIRPSRQDEAQWAQFIDIEHPKAIHNHPNFVI